MLRVERLSEDERKRESLRRQTGAEAAQKAAQDAVAAGGELTVGAMVSETSPLSASRNMLMLAASPSMVLDMISGILESASRGEEDLKASLLSIRAMNIGFGLRVTDQYKPIFEAEMQRQIPVIQKYSVAKKVAVPPKPVPEPPKPEQNRHPAYSEEEATAFFILIIYRFLWFSNKSLRS